MNLLKKTLCLLLALMMTLTVALTAASCNDDSDVPPDDGGEEDGGNASAAVPGNNVGNLAYSADIPLLLEEGSFNPAKNTGKVTVVNFWGTWCGPCKAELPEFDRLAAEYTDKLTIFAVHSIAKSEDPVGYVTELFPDSEIIFGQDASGDMFYNLYGGNGYYPFTMILDPDGVIVYKQASALSYEQLKALVDGALAE